MCTCICIVSKHVCRRMREINSWGRYAKRIKEAFWKYLQVSRNMQFADHLARDNSSTLGLRPSIERSRASGASAPRSLHKTRSWCLRRSRGGMDMLRARAQGQWFHQVSCSVRLSSVGLQHVHCAPRPRGDQTSSPVEGAPVTKPKQRTFGKHGAVCLRPVAMGGISSNLRKECEKM